MSNAIAAIPTKYSGVQFRSRLEARWAAFFDLLGWTWAYEPIDLDGYIPDFILTADRRLIEVKPALKLADYEPAQEKIKRSGWTGPAATVGAIVGEYPDHDCVLIGMEWIDCEFWTPWLAEDKRTTIRMWHEAGNKVQWKKPSRARAPKATKEPRHIYHQEAPPRPPEADIVPTEDVGNFFAKLALEWTGDDK